MWNAVILVILVLGVALMHVLGGGTRLVFSQPAYGLVGVAALLAALLPGRFRMPARPWVIGVVVVFAAYVLVRALNSPVDYLSRFHVFATLGALAAYLLVATRLTEQNLRLWLVGGLLLICLPHMVYGAVQFTTSSRDFNVVGIIPPNYAWRASGMLMCPTHLGDFMAMMTMLAAAITVWARIGWTSRLLFAYMTVVCLAGTVIAGSRGPFLAIACASLLFAFLSIASVRSVHRGRAILMSGGILALLFGLIGGALYYINTRPQIMARLQNSLDFKNMRFEMWEAALVPWFDKPWFGTGAWTFLYYGRMFRPFGGYQKDPIHAHNDYVHTLAEYGIIGFVLLVVVMVLHFGSGWDTIKWLLRERLEPSLRRTSTTLALMIGCLSAFGVFATHAVVDFNMHIPANLLVITLLLAILANPAAGENKSESRPSRVFGLSVRGLLMLIGVATLWLTWRYWPAEIQAEKARAALRDDEYLQAIVEGKKGLALDPTNPELYHHIGEARLFSAGRFRSRVMADALYRDAAKYLQQGLELFPQDVWRQINLAQALDSGGLHDEAYLVYREAIRLDPNSAQPYEYMGLHFERIKDYSKAIEYYNKALHVHGAGAKFARKNLRALQKKMQQKK